MCMNGNIGSYCCITMEPPDLVQTQRAPSTDSQLEAVAAADTDSAGQETLSFIDGHDVDEKQHVEQRVMGAKGRPIKPPPPGWPGQLEEWKSMSANQRGVISKRYRRTGAIQANNAAVASQHQPLPVQRTVTPLAPAIAPGASAGASAGRPLWRRQQLPRGRTAAATAPATAQASEDDADAEDDAICDGDNDVEAEDADHDLNYSSCPPSVTQLFRELIAKPPGHRGHSKFELNSRRWVYDIKPTLDTLTCKVEEFYEHKLVLWDPASTFKRYFQKRTAKSLPVLPCPRYVRLQIAATISVYLEIFIARCLTLSIYAGVDGVRLKKFARMDGNRTAPAVSLTSISRGGSSADGTRASCVRMDGRLE